jgi:hypothetical protein
MKFIPAMLLAVTLLACQGGRPFILELDGVRLADVSAHVPVVEAPRLVVKAGQPVPALPAGARQVQLAVDREMPFGELRSFLQAIDKAGVRAQILVSVDGKLGALPPSLPAVPQSILLAVEMGEEVKACVAEPGAEVRACVSRKDGLHVERAFVRELVREAVKTYELTAVHVRPDPKLAWIEVVRAVDGARTCCKGTEIKVSVEDASL